MQVCVLNLDGSILRQEQLLSEYRAKVSDVRSWGPRIRLGCSHARFRRFERMLFAHFRAEGNGEPALTLYGSGDFHHVSLALLRRLPGPFNLLVLDNHPDWMRGMPFLHCGTWLYHAARLPQVRNIFHLGGNVDFDNGFRRLAPWSMLRSGKITVIPGFRSYRKGGWKHLAHEPLRSRTHARLQPRRLADLLFSFRNALRSCPLYISLDKDVMTADQAAVNWDSGHLHLTEVEDILRAFMSAALGRIAGMDIVGDWSPVRIEGIFRKFLHWTEHPRLAIQPHAASRLNEQTNLQLLRLMTRVPAVTPALVPAVA